jgi:hypothetical protein
VNHLRLHSPMKKLINQPTHYVEEMLAGLLLANPSLKLDGGSQRVIRRASGARAGKVGIASGGGSGHLPLFTGYVGEGLLNTCSVAFDERGRMFVSQGPQYRNPKPDTPPDSVVLLDDTNGDGGADKARTFATGFNCIQGWRGTGTICGWRMPGSHPRARH